VRGEAGGGFGYPTPETRNPKPETRNPKPETRNPKPETRNPRPYTRYVDRLGAAMKDLSVVDPNPKP